MKVIYVLASLPPAIVAAILAVKGLIHGISEHLDADDIAPGTLSTGREALGTSDRRL
ncbi:MAG TPA: hypothetical protein VMT68_03350 [Caulobacteraceae bacterium]|nr:hypothetical protein [Caulobacteraceae bacterium]